MYDSFRVAQCAGMFDVSVAEKATRRFEAEVPGLDEDWRVGCIVGPSGSGKSTVAAVAYGDTVDRGHDWPHDRAVIDAFGERGVKDISAALTAVGFSSPPSWIKPYAVLSNGEKFRCDLARCLLSDSPLVVFDEFTSVVDRTVAKIGSAAIAKAVRRHPTQRFVAVTCHYDVAEWLEADWVLDMATCQLARGRLRRPPIELELFRCDRAAWRVFGPHHYLSGAEHKSWSCWLATWQEEPVAMVCTLGVWGYPGYQRISRIVVLPDYQGVGIARAVLRLVSRQLLAGGAKQVTLTTGHPSMIRSLERSGDWRCTTVCSIGSRQRGRYSIVHGRRVARTVTRQGQSHGRCVVRFRFYDTATRRSSGGENSPSLPETGVKNSKARGRSKTQANCRSGSTAVQVAVESAG